MVHIQDVVIRPNFFVVEDSQCRVAHHDKDKNQYYVNVRDTSSATAKPIYVRKYVNQDHVYRLTRHYRYSKSNSFYNMIATIKAVTSVELHQFYFYLNRWTKVSQGIDNFVVERHGNATKPYAGAYYRKDKALLDIVRGNLSSGASPDEVYLKVSKENDSVKSVSQMLPNPKVVHNQTFLMSDKREKNGLTEGETLINLVHGDPFVSSVHFDTNSYSSVNYTPAMINDLKRFCVFGNSPWILDTTFKVAEKLWLTDSAYENESLVDENGKHPLFPGPSQWQFRRDQQSFRRFAGKLVITDAALINIKKVGHDMDSATVNGVGEILINANHLWCTQHMQGADMRKLEGMGASQKTANRIMSDILRNPVSNTSIPWSCRCR